MALRYTIAAKQAPNPTDEHVGARVRVSTKIEELNDSLVNLLFDPAEVILKPSDERACRIQWVLLRHVVFLSLCAPSLVACRACVEHVACHDGAKRAYGV
jgi:hypothetical protein